MNTLTASITEAPFPARAPFTLWAASHRGNTELRLDWQTYHANGRHDLPADYQLTGAMRHGRALPIYDDGTGALYIHRDSMGISGIVRAATWEDAYGICEDEFFPAGDVESGEGEFNIPYDEMDAHTQACWDEAFGYRGGGRKEEDGSHSYIYAKDIHGDALDRLTPRLMQELDISITVSPW